MNMVIASWETSPSQCQPEWCHIKVLGDVSITPHKPVITAPSQPKLRAAYSNGTI